MRRLASTVRRSVSSPRFAVVRSSRLVDLPAPGRRAAVPGEARPEAGRRQAASPAACSSAIAKAGGRPTSPTTDPPVLPVLGADADDFAADKVVTLDGDSDTFPLGKLERPARRRVRGAGRLRHEPRHQPAERPRQPLLRPGDGEARPRRRHTVVDLTLDKAYAERPPKDTADAQVPQAAVEAALRLPRPADGVPRRRRAAAELREGTGQEVRPDRRHRRVRHAVHLGRAASPPTRGSCRSCPTGPGRSATRTRSISANNGPYGEALTKEVIPHIEKTYRCLGTPKSRFTTGGSTGGWVSLALQVFYPDYFNGCWSQCPDSVTFERFELIDIYRDANAYVNRYGFDRPEHADHRRRRGVHGAARVPAGARAGPRRAVGTERPRLGELERGLRPEGQGRPARCRCGTARPARSTRASLDHWKKYDLKLVLEQNWKTLGPKLAGGKVNVWVGDADDYFLNVAVHRLKASPEQLTEPEVRRHDPDRDAEGPRVRRVDAEGDARRDGRPQGEVSRSVQRRE